MHRRLCWEVRSVFEWRLVLLKPGKSWGQLESWTLREAKYWLALKSCSEKRNPPAKKHMPNTSTARRSQWLPANASINKLTKFAQNSTNHYYNRSLIHEPVSNEGRIYMTIEQLSVRISSERWPARSHQRSCSISLLDVHTATTNSTLRRAKKSVHNFDCTSTKRNLHVALSS